MLNPKTNNIIFTNEEYKLYSKHLIIDNIGINGQKRLKTAKVLMIGAGGLGCPAMLYLIASGIGYLGIIDNDYIEISNLPRQLLYKKNNINNLKTIQAKEKLQTINNKCKIIIHKYKLSKNNAAEIIKYYDIIIDGCDNFETKYIIDTICFNLHKTYIYGGIQNFEGQISVFNYKSGPRYIDIYPIQLNLNLNNCNNNGVINIIAGTIGLLQATETIKIILGIGKISYKKILVYNLLYSFLDKIKVYSKKIQSQAYEQTYIYNNKYISYTQFKEIKNTLNKHFLLIDIRSQNEFITKHMYQSINIPIQNFKIKNTIYFLQKYNKTHIIIIYCKNINRSLIVSNLLQKIHIKHFILNQIKS